MSIPSYHIVCHPNTSETQLIFLPITPTFYLLSIFQMSEKKCLSPNIEEEPMQHISVRAKVRIKNLP